MALVKFDSTCIFNQGWFSISIGETKEIENQPTIGDVKINLKSDLTCNI